MKHNGEDLPQTVAPCHYNTRFDGALHLKCAEHNAQRNGAYLMRWDGREVVFEKKSPERLAWEKEMGE